MDTSLSSQAPCLDRDAIKIIEIFEKMDNDQIKDFFKIKDGLAGEVYGLYKNIRKNTAKAAIESYQGLSFSQIDPVLYRSSFAKDHLVILSALYGPLGPMDPINPYRLDFSKSLKVGVESLKTLQRRKYTEKLKASRVYNLASKEFADRVDKNALDSWVDIIFYGDLEKKKKAPSATSKKLRGQLVNHILKEESLERAAFESFAHEGYSFDSLSDDKTYIYAK